MDKKIYDAVQKIDPFKSDEIAARYEKLTFQLDSAIASELIYTDEHNHYKSILSQLEDSANMLVSHAESMIVIDKEGSLSDFLQELDYVSQSLMGDPNMLLLSESPSGLELIDNEFNSIEAALSHLGIGYKLDNYKTEYLSVPSENRVSITKLSTSFEEIYRKSNNSSTSLAYLSNSTNKISTALGYYVSGSEKASAADKIMEEVNTRLDNIQEVEDFSAELNKKGIKGLDIRHTEALMTILGDNKITTKKALSILSQMQKRPEFYGDITKLKLSNGDLTEYLVVSILEYTKGNEGKYRVKHTMFIETNFSNNLEKINKKMDDARSSMTAYATRINKFKENYPKFQKEAKDYARKNPKAKEFSAEISNKIHLQLQNYIKLGEAEITSLTNQRSLQFNKVKYELAYQYLNKKGVKSTWKQTDKVIKELWAINNLSELESFSSKHKVGDPALFNLIFLLDSQIQAKKGQIEIKKSFDSGITRDKINPTDLYSYFNFINTGEFDRTGVSLKVHLSEWASEIYNELLNYDLLQKRIIAESKIVQPYLQKYNSLKDIPKSKRIEINRRMQSYILLIQFFRASAGKLNGMKLTLEQLSKKNTYKGRDRGLQNRRIYYNIESDTIYHIDKKVTGHVPVGDSISGRKLKETILIL